MYPSLMMTVSWKFASCNVVNIVSSRYHIIGIRGAYAYWYKSREVCASLRDMPISEDLLLTKPSKRYVIKHCIMTALTSTVLANRSWLPIERGTW